MTILQRLIDRLRAVLPLSQLRAPLRYVFTVRDEGVRTALATVLPVVVGQATHYPIVGLMAGLGGLYVSPADKEKATTRTLLLATIIVALSALLGTVAGGSLWLSVVLMAGSAFVGGMLAVYGILPGQLGFVAMLVSAVALGIAGPLAVAEQRGLEFGAGGVWATQVTLGLWHIRAGDASSTDAASALTRRINNEKIKRQTNAAPNSRRGNFSLRLLRRPLRELRRNLTLRSEVCQHALRLAFSSAFAVWLYKYLRLEHGSWLTITVLVIVKPDYHSTRARALEWVYDTLAGGIIALALASTIHSVVAADALLLVLRVLAFSHQPQNYGLYAVFLTPFVVLLLQLATPGTAHLAFARVLNTLLGGALAFSTVYLLRPRTRGET